MVKCSKCGAELKEHSKFCSKCGSPRDSVVNNNTVPQVNQTKNSNTKMILIILLIIFLVAVVGAFIILTQSTSTNLNISSASTLNDGDTFTVVLSDNKGNPIANQDITIEISSSEGVSITQKVVTDSNGVAHYPISDFAAGSYTFKCIFEGNGKYSSSTTTQYITINSGSSSSTSTGSSSSGSSSSSSSSSSSGSSDVVVGEDTITNHLGHTTHVTYYADGSAYYTDLVNHQSMKILADGTCVYY